jgi:malonate decarboxylase beta subunit
MPSASDTAYPRFKINPSIKELDARDRSLIWSMFGGQQRYDQGLADVLVDDDADKIAKTVRDLVGQGVPTIHRSEQVDLYRSRIATLDTSRQWDPKELRSLGK